MAGKAHQREERQTDEFASDFNVPNCLSVAFNEKGSNSSVRQETPVRAENRQTNSLLSLMKSSLSACLMPAPKSFHFLAGGGFFEFALMNQQPTRSGATLSTLHHHY